MMKVVKKKWNRPISFFYYYSTKLSRPRPGFKWFSIKLNDTPEKGGGLEIDGEDLIEILSYKL